MALPTLNEALEAIGISVATFHRRLSHVTPRLVDGRITARAARELGLSLDESAESPSESRESSVIVTESSVGTGHDAQIFALRMRCQALEEAALEREQRIDGLMELLEHTLQAFADLEARVQAEPAQVRRARPGLLGLFSRSQGETSVRPPEVFYAGRLMR